MEQKQTIMALIKDCTLYFEQNCYTKHRVEHYKAMWRRGICRYMEEKKIRYFNPSVGSDFIKERFSSFVTPAERDVMRSISVLAEMQETGRVSRRTVKPLNREPKGAVGEAINALLSWLRRALRSESTLRGHLLYLHRFNQFLDNNGVGRLEDMKEGHILTFVSTQTNSRVNVASSLRVFFQFLYEEGQLKQDWSHLLKNYKWTKREKLPSVYSKEEVLRIEASVCRSSGVGKRNYAMLLLSTRLGLRSSDIADLSFSNLDWVKSH